MRITTSCLLFAALVAASARAQSWRPAPEPVTLLPTTILTVPSPVVVRAAGQLSDPRTALPAPRLVAGDKTETPFAGAFPIDLPTALRLGNASSPTIAIALARVREALARVDQADALKLPTLSAGGIYLRHDGLDQNRRAELFRVSRQSVFAGGGASLRVDLGDAYYQPLVARQLATAEAATARAITNTTLLDITSAYFDLVEAHGLLAVNADILERDLQILKASRSGEKQGLNKTAADVNRAETEVSLRQLERHDLTARAQVASARLVRFLVLDPTVTLVPADSNVVLVELFPADLAIPQLVEQAVRSRPELEAAAARIEAADLRSRQARYAPLFPKLQADYVGGEFGGGKNGAISNLESRGDLSAQLFWELRGLGFGNVADTRLREAERDRAVLTGVAARAEVAAEVVEAARTAQARRQSVADARKATEEAAEMFRKLSATSFGMIGGKGQFDALEPLTAVQALNQSRIQYLAAVVEFNRAQFRLMQAVGQPVTAQTDLTRP